MDFALIERLKEAAETIHFPTTDDTPARAAERKAIQRREFASLMRSIKSLVRDDT